MEGRVKWFDEKKGYGFIETESQGDVFVHIKHTHRPLMAGEWVSFELQDGPRGPYASHLKPSPKSPFCIVSAGEALSNTGERLYIPRNERRLTWQVNWGYRTGRGDWAVVLTGTLGLRARWSRREFDLELVRIEGPSDELWGWAEEMHRPPEEIIDGAEINPQEFDAAIRWLELGRRGRQSSYWPVVACLRCEPWAAGFHRTALGIAGVPCPTCGHVGPEVIWVDVNC